MKFKRKEKGFTVIELIVVVAIIAILAAIVTTSVTQYIGTAKLSRANADVQNIAKALEMFKSTYGDYPWGLEGSSNICSSTEIVEGCSTRFYGSNELYDSQEGTEYSEPFIYDKPFLMGANGTKYFLSEFYNSDYNANYFANNGYYNVSMWDDDGDGKIGCGLFGIYGNNRSYGFKLFLSQDCAGIANTYQDLQFQLKPY